MKIRWIIFPFFISTQVIFTQMNHHEHGMDSTMQMNDSMQMDHSMHMMNIEMISNMSMEGSGTSWQPESTPMHMHMYNAGNWMLMLHGNIFIRYEHQDGIRGGGKFDAPNWLMFSARRMLGKDNELMLRTMLSIDRITEDGIGYPLLFQTGESWNGIPLVDRQHPHDFFSELSITFTHKFSNKFNGYIYAGYPGEPAFGPPVFMHRLSAASIPDAPISHHWQDATHISFGVITAGAVYKNVKVEGSILNGREPDENRYDFDKLRLDSYSGRISYNPTKELALQFSYSSLKNPEGNGIDVKRTTASIMYSKIFRDDIYWASTLVWGENNNNYAGHQESFLLESQFTFHCNSIYTRLENVQKPQSDLGIFNEPAKKENLGVYTFGYKRNLFNPFEIGIDLGGQFTVYSFPEELKPFYGKGLFSYEINISIHPTLMHSHGHMNHMNHMPM